MTRLSARGMATVGTWIDAVPRNFPRLLNVKCRGCVVASAHAGKYDLLPLIIANLSAENVERAHLVLAHRAHVAAVNGQ
jgi:hypothetical protein